MKASFLFLFFTIIVSLAAAQTGRYVEIEGHRGARGLLPENTVPSFIKAVELGVDTIELDVVVSKDNKIVVSHEPWFSHAISLDAKGNAITEAKEKEHNIYKMSYAEAKRYDVGSIGNTGFPEQMKLKVYKPLLSHVFEEVQKHIRTKSLKQVSYNIEIKSNPQGDGTFHPTPPEFAKLVFDEILKYELQNHVIVQSFDVRPLQELRKMPRKLPLALLVSNRDGFSKNIERLGFQPNTYSPHFSLVDEGLVRSVHEKKMKIVPWTVNEVADLERMKTFDLDGIITDYPDRAVKIFRR